MLPWSIYDDLSAYELQTAERHHENEQEHAEINSLVATLCESAISNDSQLRQHLLSMTQDEYSKFISDHGGSTNAYTAAESTNYHFSVKRADHLFCIALLDNAVTDFPWSECEVLRCMFFQYRGFSN